MLYIYIMRRVLLLLLLLFLVRVARCMNDRIQGYSTNDFVSCIGLQ